MAPFIARAILWLIFTIILFDTIQEFNKLFQQSVNPYFAIVPAVLNFLFGEYIFKKWKFNQEVQNNKSTESRIDKILLFMGLIIVGSLILCVLIVWALVIYKAAIKGGL
jgi:hypothetical protein